MTTINGVIFDEFREQVTQTVTAATMPNATTTIFTVAGPANAAWKILDLISVCVTTNNTNGATQQWQFDGTLGTATTISVASASLASLVAGDMTVLEMTALTTAVRIVATGTSGGLGPAAGHIGLYMNGPGVIQNIIGTAATTGTWNHIIRWKALSRGVSIVPAF